jgi:hypothetical protein
VKSVFEAFHLAARLYKVFDDVEIIATSMRETLGVVQNEVRILRRGDFVLDIWDAGFATVLHSLQFEVSRLPMTLSAWMLQSTAKLIPKIAFIRLDLPTPDYEPE